MSTYFEEIQSGGKSHVKKIRVVGCRLLPQILSYYKREKNGKVCGSKKIEKIRTDTMAALHGVVAASPLESQAQDKCNQYYVHLGVFL